MAHVMFAQQDFNKQQKLEIARESKQLRNVKDQREAAPKTEKILSVSGLSLRIHKYNGLSYNCPIVMGCGHYQSGNICSRQS